MRRLQWIGLAGLLVLCPIVAQAEPEPMIGTLTLAGRVVANPCQSQLDSSRLSLRCSDTEQVSDEVISIATLQQAGSKQLASARVDYHWVDPAHSMAIIAISHR